MPQPIRVRPRGAAAVTAVLGRELREVLREPHVLMFSLGFPLLFYPLLIWGALQILLLREGWDEAAPSRVAVSGPADLVAAIEEEPVVRAELPTDPEAALREGSLDAVVVGTGDAEALSVTVWGRSTEPASERALKLVHERLDELREDRILALAALHEIPPQTLQPWSVDREDQSPREAVLANFLAITLPLVVTVSLLMSAMYPALDVVVGERERGTLETTLTTAAPRWAIGVGKLGAVFAVTLLGALGNLGAMALTLLHLLSLMGGDRGVGLAIHGPEVVLAAVALGSAALLASALGMLLALPARTFQGGQMLVTNVLMLFSLVSVVATQPDMTLSGGLLFVPFANSALVVRSALTGGGSWGLSGAAVGWNLALAGGAVALGSLWWRRADGLGELAFPAFLRRWGGERG